MSMKPMAYENIECVLRHIDANTRIQISNRCPSIRALEKRVPLNINYLMLQENGVVLNNAIYKIGIICEYNEERVPWEVVWSNYLGGVQYEVDRFGIKNMSDATTLTPGDIAINLSEIEDENRRLQRNEVTMVRNLEWDIQGYEEELAELKDIGAARETIREIEDHLENRRAQLQARLYRRGNVTPPYEHFVQLTMTRDDNEQKKIERYTHNKTYSEALKQLTTVLFGGRKCQINVKSLQFICHQGIIRLPANLKFHIEHLILKGNTEKKLKALDSIIHELSYPLKKLTIDVFSEADVNDPVVKNAEKLEAKIDSENIPQILSSVSNQQVYVRTEPFSEEIMEDIIENWIAANRPIGSDYTFELDKKPEFADKMGNILKRLNGVPIDSENMLILMYGSVELKVSYGRCPGLAPCWAVRLVNEVVKH